jgi:hypothetical protein
MVPIYGTQLSVDRFMVTRAISVHFLPGPSARWLDNPPLFQAPCWWDQERTSQPAKFIVVTSYKNSFN